MFRHPRLRWAGEKGALQYQPLADCPVDEAVCRYRLSATVIEGDLSQKQCGMNISPPSHYFALQLYMMVETVLGYVHASTESEITEIACSMALRKRRAFVTFEGEMSRYGSPASRGLLAGEKHR